MAKNKRITQIVQEHGDLGTKATLEGAEAVIAAIMKGSKEGAQATVDGVAAFKLSNEINAEVKAPIISPAAVENPSLALPPTSPHLDKNQDLVFIPEEPIAVDYKKDNDTIRNDDTNNTFTFPVVQIISTDILQPPLFKITHTGGKKLTVTINSNDIIHLDINSDSKVEIIYNMNNSNYEDVNASLIGEDIENGD